MKRQSMKRSFGINLRPGTRIVGKWQGNCYTIVRKLGSGMVGSVYLCRSNGKYVALKISRQSLSMTKEVNVLKALKKAQDKFLGPSLFDVDDFVINKSVSYSFYVMEYINGESFVAFMRKQQLDWVTIVLIQVLTQLHHLHKIGWVFGDLKVENLMIEYKSNRVRFIDVGGTTKRDRSVKEYTEFYDRGYWGLGSRKAEPSYDLFAVVMVFLAIYYPNQFKKKNDPLQQLDNKIDQVANLKLFRKPFKRAIRGKYKSAAEMKDDIFALLANHQSKGKEKREKSWLEPILILLFVNIFFISTLFMF